MRPRQTISSMQAIYFSFASAYGGIIFFHSQVFQSAGRATWLAEGLGGALLFIPALYILYLAGSSPGNTIFEILENSAGRFIGWVFGGSYVLISIILSALMLKLFAGVISSFILHNTPAWFTSTVILLLAALIARSGIETVGRLTIILEVILISVFFSAMGFGFAGQYDFRAILPVFDRDLIHILDGVYLAGGGLGEILLFIPIMVAALPQPSKAYKPLAWGLFYAVVIIPMLVTFLIEALISPDEAARIYFAGINASMVIQVGKFIQGLEIFILITYELITLEKIVIHLLSSRVVLSQLFRNHKQADLGFVLIVVAIIVLTTMLGSFNEAYSYYVDVARYIILPYIILTIGITSLFYFIKKRRWNG